MAGKSSSANAVIEAYDGHGNKVDVLVKRRDGSFIWGRVGEGSDGWYATISGDYQATQRGSIHPDCVSH